MSVYPPFPLTWDHRNQSLSNIVAVVREERVIEILSNFLDGRCISARLFPVRPGLSGAVSLGVDCRIEGITPPTQKRSLVFKMSRSRDLIVREYLKRKEADYFPKNLFPVFEDIPPQNSGGWYVLANEYIRHARTLKDWLNSSSACPTQVSTLFQRLFFQSGLHHVYRSPVNRGNSLQLILTASRRERILTAIDELRSLACRNDNLHMLCASRVRRFVNGNLPMSGKSIQMAAGLLCTRSHGDMHSENILVDCGTRPWLIDPGDVDILPWFADVARLTVDLIVTAPQCDGEGCELDPIKERFRQISKLIQGEPLRTKEGKVLQRPLEVALQWLWDHFQFIHQIQNKDRAEKEFRLGLAIEFLRATYRVHEIATEMRVLALLAGDFALASSLVD